MRISICLPVMGQNRARMLCDALYSILLQGYDDVELVVKDGDINNPVVNDPRVKLLFGWLDTKYEVGRDGGIFPALNDCLKRSTGQVLYFMCSDDLLCPGSLVAVNEAFEQERFGSAYWLYGKTVSADITGKTLGFDGAPMTYEQLLEHNRIGQPAVFWNRQMMDLAGMFDTRYSCASDYELWLRFWERREPLFLDQALGVFRHHDEQHSTVNSVVVDAEARSISTRHKSFSKLITDSRNAFIMRQAYGAHGIPETLN